MGHSQHQKRRCLDLSTKREMQVRILSWILLIVIISSLVSGGIFYYYSNQKIDSSYKQFHVQLHNMRQVLVPWIFFSIGLSAFLALIIALFYPRKIVGPLYRLEKRLQGIGSGNLREEIFLRPNDELQDLAKEINHMGARLRDRLISAKEAFSNIDTIINQDLSANLSREIVEKLQHESAQVKKIFNEFSL